MNVLGLHHVTAISANIAANLEFYTGTLGLRLVKKSVNQDDVSAYHLFYADAVASPGTDLTFFDWPLAAANRPGAGTVARTTFRVAPDALDYWANRLRDASINAERWDDRIEFADPEGQRLGLIASDVLLGEPWTKDVPAEHALRGFHHVELDSAFYAGTRFVLTELLGYQEVGDGLYSVEGPEGASTLKVNDRTQGQRGFPGRGGVHHVAFRAKDDDHLSAIQRKVEEAGIGTSGYVDRFYFHSLYFREPGGVLFEIATDGPGMHSDEPMDHLGEKLALPPFLEGRRAEIEANLKPLGQPVYLR